jgi:hypothetical protein
MNILIFVLNYDNIKLHVNFICINEWFFFVHININFNFKINFMENLKYMLTITKL